MNHYLTILLPALSGVLAACIWGGWMMTTKFSILHTLSVIDIVFLRFATSAVIALPFLFKFGFKLNQPHPYKKTLFLVMTCGAGYVLVASAGFIFMPASYGGVIPVCMTFFSVIIGAILYKDSLLTVRKGLCIFSILLGVALLTKESGDSVKTGWVYGMLLFIVSGLIFALYNVYAKRWTIRPIMAVAVTSFYSFVIYFPIYLLLPGKNILSADTGEIIFQIIYQGIFVAFVALLLFGYCGSKIGSSRASLFAVLTPVSNVLLSVMFLDEVVTGLMAFSMTLMVFGMFMGLLSGGKK